MRSAASRMRLLSAHSVRRMKPSPQAPNPVAGVATTGLITNPGIRWDPQATGCLSYGPGFWDSSCSGTAILAVAFGTIGETAVATAIADDPATYGVDFDLQVEVLVGERREIDGNLLPRRFLR